MSKMKELHYDLTVAAEENTNLGHAAKYLLNGWSVMPLKRKSKEPHFDLIKSAYLSATTDWELVKFWFQCDPNANIGIACRPSNLLVIDVDFRSGGEVIEEFEPTYTVKTSDGYHFYYNLNKDYDLRIGKIMNGVDVKWKGYVAAAPSIHPSGARYTVINDMQPIDLPSQLLTLIQGESW
jgi:hypothetical protein